MNIRQQRVFLLTCITVSVYIGKPLRAQQKQVFRADVHVVEVDVAVVDNEGNPIRGLTREDFILSLDDEPRQITVFDFISYAKEQIPASSAKRPTQFSSNEGALRGRLVLLVVDRGGFRPGEGRAVMTKAASFVDTLAPTDRIGVLAVPQSRMPVSFTSDRTRVKQALKGITGLATLVSGNYSIGLSEALEIEGKEAFTFKRVADRECLGQPVGGRRFCEEEILLESRAISLEAHRQTRELLVALVDLLKTLEPIEGPKSLILISGGFVRDRETAAFFDQLAWAAAVARVSVYAIQFDAPASDPSQPRSSPSRMKDSDLLADGMANVAGMARGAMFRATRAGPSSFARVERELGGYYLLGFEAKESDRDGQPHRVTVRTKGGAGIVRSRTVCIIPKELSTPTEVDLLAQVLRDPFLATDLPLRVATYSVRDPEALDTRILVSLEAGSDSAPPNDATIAFVLLDKQGNAVFDRMEKISPEDSRPTKQRALQHLISIPAPPGNYTLKLAVLDEQGSLGSIEHPVHIELDSAKGLEFSDLLISGSGSGRPGIPFVSSLDGGSGHLDMHLEIYPEDPGPFQGATVSFEVSKSEEAPPLVTSEVPVIGTGNPSRWTASERLEIHSFAPDDYIARGVVSRDGLSIAKIVRPFRLARVRPSPAAGVDLESFLPSLPNDYAKAFNQYQKGEYVAAALSLSRLPQDTVEKAREQLDTKRLSDPQLGAVALLHTEAALRTGWNEIYHLDIGRQFIERIEGPSLRKTLLKDWFLLVGYHLHRLYRYKEAMVFLEEALELSPGDNEVLMAIGAVHEAWGWMFESRQLIERAQDYYGKILKAEPSSAEAHLRLGHVLKLKEEHKDALRELDWCLSRSNGPEIEIVAHLLIGDIQKEGNQLDEAIASYRAAAERDPLCLVAVVALSHALHQAGDSTASREVMESYFDHKNLSEGLADSWLRYLRGSPERITSLLTRMREDLR